MTQRPVVVVTGASAGVGRAVVTEFAGSGFDVALIARGSMGLEAAAADVRTRGGRALPIAADVSSFDAVDEAAARIEAELGPIQVWVNNAMTTVFGRSWDCRPEEFRRAIEVTFLGQVHGTLAALSRMRPRGEGRIVNVGSALAFVGIPLQSAYCAAKFACRGFSESVRAELLAENSGVTIAMVHLPAVNTPQFDWCLSRLPRHPQPVAPIYQPERCARAVVRAALDGREVKTLGSWNKLIVLGAKLVPSALTRYASKTAIEGQQTGDPVSPDRPADLWAPVDAERDHGAHGIFDARAGGALDPSFLRDLPSTLGAFCVALAQTAAEKTRAAGRILKCSRLPRGPRSVHRRAGRLGRVRR